MEYTAIILVVVAALVLALVGVMVGKQLEYMKIFGLRTINMIEHVRYYPTTFIREMSKENPVRFRVNSTSSSFMDFSGKDLTKVCRIEFKLPNTIICYQFDVYDMSNKVIPMIKTGEFQMKMADGSPALLNNTMSTTVLKLKVWRVNNNGMCVGNLKNANKLDANTPLKKGSLVVDVIMVETVQAQIPVLIPLINNGSTPQQPDDFWWQLITPNKVTVLNPNDF